MTAPIQTQVKAAPVPILSAVHSNLLQRKCTCGGTPGPSGECEECRKKRLTGAGGFQAKLAVSRPGDKWEQEADRMAESVVSGVRPDVKLSPRSGHTISQSAAYQGNVAGEVPPSVHETIQAPGRPLDPPICTFMEDRFAYDFSQVRIHDDQRAAESARQVNALAYTVGRDVVFNSGQYMPSNLTGQRLLAHELAHVVQQTADSTSPIVARQQAQPTPPGQEEAQRRAQWYPNFPGCGPWQRRRVDFQLIRARSHVRDAISALHDELTPPSSGIITIAGSALEGQFHTHRPEHIRTIISRMEGILSALERGANNIRCVTQAECARECEGGGGDACASPSAPIRLCPGHFENGDYQGTMNIIHEAGHQSGRGMAGGASHIYRHDVRFVSLTTAQAMNNPDSYALFVRDLHYGGPLASARPAGSPPEAPHEREARAQREGHVWSPRDLGLNLFFEIPSIAADVGWSDGRERPVPAASRRIGNQLKGTMSFFPDAVGRERHRPYPPMAVSARFVLTRSSGRPARSVLLDVSDNAAADDGAGATLRTRFNRDFDFHFSTADRGTLQIEMRLQDFDTATTIVYRGTLLVQP